MTVRDSSYRNALNVRGLQDALTGIGSFVESFKGWDEVARRNIQLAEAQKLAERRENQYWAAMPDELQLAGLGAGDGGTSRSRSSGGAQADFGVTLGEAVAAMQADNAAKEQAMLGAEEQLVAAQEAASRRALLEQGPAFLGQRQQQAELEAVGLAEEEAAQRQALTDQRMANLAQQLQGTGENVALVDEAARRRGVPAPALGDAILADMSQRPAKRGPWMPGEPISTTLEPSSPRLQAALETLSGLEAAPVAAEQAAIIDPEAEQSAQPTRRLPGSGGPGDTGLGTWVAINEEEAVDAAAVAGGTAAVAAELGGETAKVGTLASKLMGLEATATVDEAKAEVERLGRDGVIKNPLAEFSGVVEESYLPSIVQLRYAVASAKDGDRTHIEDILGRSVSRSEVKKLDKLLANYRDYAGGLSMKADEVRRTKRDAALEKKRAEGDTFAALVVGDLAKLKSPEEAEILADHLGEMYTYDPAGARGLLSFYRGMKKDEVVAEAKRVEAVNKEARLRAKSAVGGKGAKQAMVDYFKELSQASDAAKKSDEAQKNIDSQTLTNQQTADWVKKKAIYDSQVAYHRDRAEKARAKSQGIDFSTRIALISGFTGDFDKKHREKFDKAKDKEAAWATYEDRVASMLASTYGGSGGTYLGIEEDVASIMKSLRAHYVAPAATTVDETKPTPDDAKVYQKPLTEEARGTMGPKGAAAFEKQRVTYLSTLIEKKEAEVAKVPILRNRLAIAQSNEDLRGALKIKDELNSLRKRLSRLAKQYEEITDSKPEGFVEPVDELLRDIGSMVTKYQQRQTPGFGHGQRRPSGGVGGGRAY